MPPPAVGGVRCATHPLESARWLGAARGWRSSAWSRCRAIPSFIGSGCYALPGGHYLSAATHRALRSRRDVARGRPGSRCPGLHSLRGPNSPQFPPGYARRAVAGCARTLFVGYARPLQRRLVPATRSRLAGAVTAMAPDPCRPMVRALSSSRSAHRAAWVGTRRGAVTANSVATFRGSASTAGTDPLLFAPCNYPSPLLFAPLAVAKTAHARQLSRYARSLPPFPSPATHRPALAVVVSLKSTTTANEGGRSAALRATVTISDTHDRPPTPGVWWGRSSAARPPPRCPPGGLLSLLLSPVKYVAVNG